MLQRFGNVLASVNFLFRFQSDSVVYFVARRSLDCAILEQFFGRLLLEQFYRRMKIMFLTVGYILFQIPRICEFPLPLPFETGKLDSSNLKPVDVSFASLVNFHTVLNFVNTSNDAVNFVRKFNSFRS